MNKETVFNELEKFAKDFFPKTGEWHGGCFKRPTTLSNYAFPCNLYEETSKSSEWWLLSMFREKYDLYFLDEEFLKEFIRTSEVFKNEKEEYARRIVKWQIEWMINGGEGWIVDPSLGGDFYQFSPKCDIAFRKGIKDTLLKIGLINDVIEEGIEVNHELWREKEMKLAFRNTFDPIILFVTLQSNFKNKIELNPLLKEYWMMIHEYDYYIEHKASVDKYNSHTEAMKMEESEAKALRKELKVLEKERKQQLDILEKERKRISYGYNI